jgi:uncharacterized protein with HEPN domain
MPRSVELYLNDILTAIQRIEGYVEGLDEDDLASDQMRLDGILYNLTTIGEAVKNIPENIRNRTPEVRWREAIRFRDRVAHHYFSIDPSIIWEIVSIDMPALRPHVEKLLQEVKQEGSDQKS